MPEIARIDARLQPFPVKLHVDRRKNVLRAAMRPSASSMEVPAVFIVLMKMKPYLREAIMCPRYRMRWKVSFSLCVRARKREAREGAVDWNHPAVSCVLP